MIDSFFSLSDRLNECCVSGRSLVDSLLAAPRNLLSLSLSLSPVTHPLANRNA